MKNKVLKMVVAMLLIIVMTMSDFIFIGMNVVADALENGKDATSHPNVKFMAYFKTEKGEDSQAQYKIDSEEMKLYMKVSVKSQGYFDGVITLEDCNFKLKPKGESRYISKVEENKITLNRIRAGVEAEIEVAIDVIDISEIESYEEDMLNKVSTIKLSGDYKDSTEKTITIEAEKNVTLTLLAPEDIDTELTSKVITNRIYKIGEESKRIVQIEIHSKVIENAYPIKTTTFELQLPSGAENVQVIAEETTSTNGKLDRKLEESTYTHDSKQNTLKVTIENTVEDGKKAWNKDAEDIIIVTLTLPEEVEITSEQEYSIKAIVELDGTEQKKLEKEEKYNLSEEVKDGMIRADIQNEEVIYKGKIYSKEEREYKTQTNIKVNYENLIETSTIEEKTLYKTETEEKQANVQYKETIINKEEVENILGEEGTLTIKNNAGKILSTINANTQEDEEGNIKVTYEEGIKEITIEISKAKQTGIIRLKHTKVIKQETYTKEEITAIKGLIEQATVKYISNKDSVEYNFKRITELKETKTLAELTVVPTELSTVTVNEQVKIALVLKADNEMYDLYKNPTLKIKLPDYVTNIEIVNQTALYLDNLKVTKYAFSNATKEILINLEGEQLKYNGVNTNVYIELLADIKLDETTPNIDDSITLTYTNEKAVAYENDGNDGKAIVPVSISGYSGLISYNRITNYNLNTNSVTSKEEQIGDTKMYSNATEANAQIILVNNTENDLNNVKVLGNLPVDGEITIADCKIENNLGATIKTAITTQNSEATVYYTSNKDATNDLQNGTNGWKTNLNEVTNPILYMIVIPSMKEATKFIADYTVNIPANLPVNKQMKTTYEVEYVNDGVSQRANAVPVGLETGNVEVTIEASVGTEKLNDGSVVKAGEVIKYTVNVTNTGSNAANNVKVSLPVPEGTVYVERVELIKNPNYDPENPDSDDEEYSRFTSAEEYFKEDAEKKLIEQNIDKIEGGETKTLEYEVRVNKGVTPQTVKSQATIVYNDISIQSNEISLLLEAGKLRVTLKRKQDARTLIKRHELIDYIVLVENISNEKLENINLNLNIPEEFKCTKVSIFGDNYTEIEAVKQITIDSLEANSSIKYMMLTEVGNIKEQQVTLDVFASATCEENTYKSNLVREIGYGGGVAIDIKATREEEYLNADDTVDFEITITNNTTQDVTGYSVQCEIPDGLEITKLQIDGEEQEVLNKYHILKDFVNISAGQVIKIKVTVTVPFREWRKEIETVKTSATLLYLADTEETTREVTHYLAVCEEEEPPVQEPTRPVDPGKPQPPQELTPTEPDNPNKPDEPDNPDNPDNPNNPNNPDDPDNPDNPNNPDNPDNPDNPNNPDNPDEPTKNKYNISGKAWVDRNENGELDDEDTALNDIKVRLLNVENNEFVRDESGTKDLIENTDEKGEYLFTNIIEGKYIVVFEYDTDLYKPTMYEKQGISSSQNSNIVMKKLEINGEEKQYGATNEINLNQDTKDINMGLVFAKKFDIQIDKYISKIIVQTSQGTKTYDYTNKDFARVEISAKRIIGSTIIVQYTIKATNIGDVDAYINSLVDYAPKGLKFSSELNKDWYEANGNLYTNSLAKTAIAPGESKEINLVLTKTKTDGNAELINNMTEIQEAYNIYGIVDTNSKEENQNKDENDIGSADLLISIQTGSAFSYITIVMSMLIVIAIAAYLINKKLLLVDFRRKEGEINDKK